MLCCESNHFPQRPPFLAACMLQVDGDGIPVVSAISRSSSGCILDAPGSVQVGLVGWVGLGG